MCQTLNCIAQGQGVSPSNISPIAEPHPPPWLIPFHHSPVLPQITSSDGSQPPQCSWTPLSPHPLCPRPPGGCPLPVLSTQRLAAVPGVWIILIPSQLWVLSLERIGLHCRDWGHRDGTGTQGCSICNGQALECPPWKEFCTGKAVRANPGGVCCPQLGCLATVGMCPLHEGGGT